MASLALEVIKVAIRELSAIGLNLPLPLRQQPVQIRQGGIVLGVIRDAAQLVEVGCRNSR